MTTLKEAKHVIIFDTTLRDGQQCPGAGMSFENNMAYARLAQKVGVDVLEAGFPSASKLDFEIVNAIAAELSANSDSPIIAALCQLRSDQVDKTIEALYPAIKNKKARMHVYLPVDPRLMAASLGEQRAANKSQLLADLDHFVSRAVKAGLEVEFSPEGYSRQAENFDFVTDLIRTAVNAGATTINCPDTIGGASRYEGADYFVEKMKLHAAIIAKEFPSHKVIWSMHCHNDFGLALENSLNGVFFGPALQIEGCFNGVGERAGNVALEQCVMNIKHFGSSFPTPFITTVKTQHLKEISDFIKNHMLPRQPHSPIVGENAMRHSSGGHTNAILKDPLAYQPFDPNEVGAEITFSFGPLSGGNHARSIIQEHGFVCDESEKAQIAQFIKDIYQDRRKGITDQELIDAYFEFRKPVAIERFSYGKDDSRATVTLEGKFFSKTGKITGEITGKDSALAALKSLIDAEFPGLEIVSHRGESSGRGTSATCISYIVVQGNSADTFAGKGEDQDIEISAMKALVDAANKAYVNQSYRKESQEYFSNASVNR